MRIELLRIDGATVDAVATSVHVPRELKERLEKTNVDVSEVVREDRDLRWCICWTLQSSHSC